MRKKWTNLILHTTALISQWKQNILVSHAFRAVFDILIIIVLEFFLALISLPLYLVSQETGSGDKKQYKIRRIITLSVLMIILAIWLIKLIFVLSLPFYSATSQTFFMSGRQAPSQTLTQNYILSGISDAQTTAAFAVPVVTEAKTTKDGSLSVTGKGNPGTEVIIIIGRIKEPGRSSGLNLYLAGVDFEGNWSINAASNDSRLAVGDYWLRTMAYNAKDNSQSGLSPALAFTVEQNLQGRITGKADVYLNYFVIIFLLLGLFSLLLLI